MELIFGREFKLDSGDPYLFYAYEFRRLIAEAKLLIVIGYGFADPHINKILKQALLTGKGPKLAVINGTCETSKVNAEKTRIALAIEMDLDKISIELVQETARSFLESDRIGERVEAWVPQDPDPFEPSS